MIVKLINPQGYCGGVKNAIKTVNELEKTSKKVYLLGEIIHNKIIVNYYKNLGYILLSEKDGTKEDLIKDIKDSIIVLQAHGSSPKVYEIAKNNNNIIVDCTCPYVSLIHNKIKEYSNNGFDIIYIGSKKHQETIGSLSQAKNIHLVEKLSDLDNLDIKNEKIYVTNQTTMSMLDIDIIYQNLKEKYPNIILDNKICLATTKRQQAVLDAEDSDLIIVVGDRESSNSNKLYELAKKKTNAIFVEDLKELKLYNLSSYNKVLITSGASTPNETVNEIKAYLESL